MRKAKLVYLTVANKIEQAEMLGLENVIWKERCVEIHGEDGVYVVDRNRVNHILVSEYEEETDDNPEQESQGSESPEVGS